MEQCDELRNLSEEEACSLLNRYMNEICDRLNDSIIDNGDLLELLLLAAQAKLTIVNGWDRNWTTLEDLSTAESRMEYNIRSLVWSYFNSPIY